MKKKGSKLVKGEWTTTKTSINNQSFWNFELTIASMPNMCPTIPKTQSVLAMPMHE